MSEKKHTAGGLLGFVEMIARMQQHGEEGFEMSDEDARDTVESLIVRARKISAAIAKTEGGNTL